MNLKFEWDKKKAGANSSKHGVDFEDASTVFLDPLSRIFDDELHSIDERREIVICHSPKGRLLLVAFTERKRGLIRIISSRAVTKQERIDYE